MYCAFSEETLEVLSQRESIRRQLASETGTGELFITDFSRKNQLRIPNFLDFYLAHVIEQPIFRIPNLKYSQLNFCFDFF